MDYSRNAQKTYALKVYIHCPECQRKVHKTLMKIDGVKSVEIDGENAKVKVSGEGIEQYTLLKALSKIGKKAEILSVNSNGMSQHMTSKKEQLSETGKLKQVEVTHSKTLKMTIGNGYTEKSCKYSTKYVTQEFHGPTVHSNVGNDYYIDHVDDDNHDYDHNYSMKVTADDCWNQEPNGVRKLEYVTNDNWNRELEHHHHGHDHNHNHSWNREPVQYGGHKLEYVTNDNWNREPEQHHQHSHGHAHNHNQIMKVTNDSFNQELMQYGGPKLECVANNHWNREPDHDHDHLHHNHNHNARPFTTGRNHCASRAALPPPLSPQHVQRCSRHSHQNQECCKECCIVM